MSQISGEQMKKIKDEYNKVDFLNKTNFAPLPKQCNDLFIRVRVAFVYDIDMQFSLN